MRTLSVIGLLGIGLVLGACGGDDPGNVVSNWDASCAQTCDTPAALPEACAGSDAGCAAGAVVDFCGCGIEGVKILACDDESCITGTTDVTGVYSIGLPVGARKMQIMGSPKGYMTMNFFSDIVGGEPTMAGSTVVLMARNDDDIQALPEEGEATASLVGGDLAITSYGGLSYPIGAPEEVSAVTVAAKYLPAYDSQPWAGKEDTTLAFHLNPLPIKAGDKAFSYVVKGGQPDTTYNVFAVDDHYGTLIVVGEATADADGTISGDGLTLLTTLILIPAT
jgi:hypothetical protein